MEFLKNLIEKLSTPQSESIGVYISSDSKLEVVLYDRELGEVKKSEKIDLKYDNVLRQIDPQEFEASLALLINKMEIPPNYPYYVSLPNILTATKALPSDLEDVELEIALNSEAEKSYIFKKTDPKTSWNLIATNEHDLTSIYLYSVLQKEQISSITQVFVRNGLKIQAIDTSFAALVRGLSIAGLINENLENHSKWAIVTVSYINYIIAKFEGAKLLNIIETPIALKSIEPEVLYSTIGAAVSEKLGVEPIDNLYIVSQTSDFIAARFASQIKLICNVHTIDDNKYKDKPLFISVSGGATEPTSPESIGTACWNNAAVNLNFNFCDVDTKNEIQGALGNLGIKKVLHLYLFMGLIVSFLLLLILTLILSGINGFLDSQITRQQVEFGNLKRLDVMPPKEFNLDRVMFDTYRQNLGVVISYDAIGATIPEKIWLHSFFVDNDLNTIITGTAYSVEDIVLYFENLEEVSKFGNLKIKSIKVASSDKEMKKNEDDFALPPPPMPGNENKLNANNYYEFTFYDVKDDSVISDMPNLIRNALGY